MVCESHLNIILSGIYYDFIVNCCYLLLLLHIKLLEAKNGWSSQVVGWLLFTPLPSSFYLLSALFSCTNNDFSKDIPPLFILFWRMWHRCALHITLLCILLLHCQWDMGKNGGGGVCFSTNEKFGVSPFLYSWDMLHILSQMSYIVS